MPNRSWVLALRNAIAPDPHKVPSRIVAGKPPVWNPNPLIRGLFAARDFLNWKAISRAIELHDLKSFDVIQLDGGADFTRNARFAKEMRASGKHVVAYYHGSDLRSRGYIPAVDEVTELRLTPEWDLVSLDSRLQYLYLPFEGKSLPSKVYSPGSPVRIGHAARNPLKGTAHVERAVRALQREFALELVLIRDMSHEEALRVKFSCDILVDQLTNEGGWGYGMSSVEALAMGLPVITNIPEAMRRQLGEHPFLHADSETIEQVLRECLLNRELLRSSSKQGREWAFERHELAKVGDSLYEHYDRLGWLK
ncbi:MAG: glycosyltransferase [Calditrichaeota bacterium]|nr:glycosyltransferase [Calditrichota bacterium]